LTSAAPAVPPHGLYFWGALEDSPGCDGVDSFYGSLLPYGDANGDAVEHQRLSSFGYYPIDYGQDNAIALNTNGTTGPLPAASSLSILQYCPSGTAICSDGDGTYMYAFGDGANAFVAIGSQGFFSLVAGVMSPSSPGSSTTGVYLNPIGIINAASYAPMTASLAPGETISLFGTNLSKVTMSPPAGPAPAILGGTQVLVNGTAAPLYYVSPGQINAVVPFEVSSAAPALATIQVVNNGTNSNAVGNMYIADSAPGIFTQTTNGIGFGAATHADYTLITPSSPAVPGETILVFLTGLGLVTPAISDGALGPTSPLSKSNLWTSNAMSVDFNDYVNGYYGQMATIQYAGLAPGLLGYQLNVTIPSSDVGPAPNGGVYLEIGTDEADNNQVQIPVGGSSSSVRPAARAPRTSHHSPHNAAARAAHPKKPTRRSLAAKSLVNKS
jgi:uncharacterized protein (TIGR03437 family)